MNKEVEQKIIEIIKSCDSLQLSTFALDKYPETRHVMNAINKNITDLDLHFMTNIKSPKFMQIKNNPNCCLYYYNPETHMSIRLFGVMEIHEAQEIKNKYWDDNYKVYGYSGISDPNYAILHFIPKEYKYYAGMELQTGNI